jgi:hypothetical protein
MIAPVPTGGRCPVVFAGSLFDDLEIRALDIPLPACKEYETAVLGVISSMGRSAKKIESPCTAGLWLDRRLRHDTELTGARSNFLFVGFERRMLTEAENMVTHNPPATKV